MTITRPGAVLVTSGPTRAYLDRVRYIANSSSGALGARIVEALIARGLRVLHIRGEGAECPVVSNTTLLTDIPIATIDDLITAIHRVTTDTPIGAVIHAMAVLDYVPEQVILEKRKSGDAVWDVRLVKTPKVIGMARELLPQAWFAGFKLESGITHEALIASAEALRAAHHLDVVIANDQDHIGQGRHEAFAVGPSGVEAHFIDKESIAAWLAQNIGSACHE